MKNWKIGIRISVGFAVVIAICAIVSIYNYNRLRNIHAQAVSVDQDSIPAIDALSTIELTLFRELELVRQHAASGSQGEMDRMDAEISKMKESATKSLKEYESVNAVGEEKELFDKVKQDRAGYWDLFDQIRRESRKGTPEGNATATRMIDSQLLPLVVRYSDDLQTVVDFNIKESRDGLNSITDSVATTTMSMLVGLALSTGLAILISWAIVRTITTPLGKAVVALDKVASGDLTTSIDVDSRDEIGQMAASLNTAVKRLHSTMQQVTSGALSSSASAQELAAASESIASGAQEQAASIEETSASIEEITATVRHSADNAEQASQLAVASKNAALQGQDVVSQAVNAMSEINSASTKISDIISTIDEIAFQTNLLAVNAAVEAARAGEEGRGFAVVASEVRNLAQRSAVAAKEIKGLINDSLRKVEAGTALVNRSGETLHDIVGSVKRVTDIVSEIAVAAREQTTGIEQVNSAMTQMDQVTQSNSAHTEEMSATAESLSEQSAHLLEIVKTFKLKDDEDGDRRFMRAEKPAEARPSRAPQPAQAFRPVSRVKTNLASRWKKPATSVPSSLSPAVPAGPNVNDSSFEDF